MTNKEAAQYFSGLSPDGAANIIHMQGQNAQTIPLHHATVKEGKIVSDYPPLDGKTEGVELFSDNTRIVFIKSGT